MFDEQVSTYFWSYSVAYSLCCHNALSFIGSTEAPSFAEAGDAIMEKVSNSKVTIPCPAEGRIRFMMYCMSVLRETDTR